MNERHDRMDAFEYSGSGGLEESRRNFVLREGLYDMLDKMRELEDMVEECQKGLQKPTK